MAEYKVTFADGSAKQVEASNYSIDQGFVTFVRDRAGDTKAAVSYPVKDVTSVERDGAVVQLEGPRAPIGIS